MPIRLQVLGGLQAFRDGVQLAWVPGQRIRSALLVYLALESEARREQLARVFWPDEEAESARHDLSQTLYLLRQALGETCIEQQGDVLRFNAPVESDARAFESALEQADYAGATGLYQGAFLKDVSLCESREFEAWVDRERAKYGRLYRRACRGRIDGLVGQSRTAEAIEAARAWAAVEPFDDEAQHRLIELLAASGQRSDALKQYELYEKLLTGEELEPLDETRALVAQLRAGDVGRGGITPARLPAAVGPPAATLAPSEGARTSAAAPRALMEGNDGFAQLAQELRPGLELIRALGEGRSGRVFLARESPLNRLVAVKVLAPALAGDRVALARFEREARAAAALNHPNAVAVHRFGYLATGVPYLVMQYVKGVTLEDKLAAEGLFPVTQARQVLAEVAGALAAAHRSGFVHRDLRPENVLCDEDGCRVLVADFGMAGVLPSAQGAELRITNAGEVLGDLEFTSPEQLRGEDSSEGSDVYALGVMGYRLLTGEGPFRARSGSAMVAAHLKEAPRPLRLLRPEVDAALADLLERCLAKEPLKRPRAAFLAQALREPAPNGEAKPAALPTSTATDQSAMLSDLLRRRLPQIVAVTAAAGLALLSFVDLLTDHRVIPEVIFQLALSTFGFSIAAAGVIAWFHGRPGRQQAPWLELLMLGFVGAAWLVTCLWIFVR